MPTCTSCGAEIVWTITEAGKRSPVDAVPAVNGNLRLTPESGFTRSRAAGAAIDLTDPDDDGARYLSHFATCAHADEHRRK